MFLSLVKINKYLIYLFLFLFFNCIYIGPIMAADTSYDNIYYDVPTGKAQYIRGITFNNDGTKMFITGGKVAQFTLSTGFDLSSTIGTSLDSFNAGSAPQDIRFNNDGTKMFLAPHSSFDLRQYSLSTAFDVTTATSDGVDYELSNRNATNPGSVGLAFNSDGTKMFTTDSANGGEIDEYSLSTGFDLSSVTYVRTLSISSNTGGDPRSLIFSPDGTTMFILDSEEIDEYVLTTGYDLSTAKYADTFAAGTTKAWSIALNLSLIHI